MGLATFGAIFSQALPVTLLMSLIPRTSSGTSRQLSTARIVLLAAGVDGLAAAGGIRIIVRFVAVDLESLS
jgi:hypothetical protein